MRHIIPVLDTALHKANLTLHNIDAIAYTEKPGLPGALVIGDVTARTLGLFLQKTTIPIHHITGHNYSAWLAQPNQPLPKFTFPLLILTVSGGHTMLLLQHNHGETKLLGQTRDDAAGEAFDKVSYLLGGPYPGGVFISKLAEKGNPNAIAFPRAMSKQDHYDFSFSGLKTAVYTFIRNHGSKWSKEDIAASFQEAIVDSLLTKVQKAITHYHPHHLLIVGGVSANQRLRINAKKRFGNIVHYPPLEWCTDNAAMIGCAAYFTQHLNFSVS